VEPDVVMGASLGGFAAAAASGALAVDDLVRSIAEQVGLVESHCPRGGMLAVLAEPELFEREAIFRDEVDLAAVNFDRNFVVTGPTEGLERVERWLSGKGITSQVLPVAYAFHSRWMDVASEPFRRCLDALPAGRPRVPLLSCETAEWVEELGPGALWRMLRAPIRFRDAVRRLEARSGDGGWLYLDLGPTGTLANFARQVCAGHSPSRCASVLDPFSAGNQGLERVKRLAFPRPAAAARAEVAPLAPARRGARNDAASGAAKAYLFPGQGSQARGMGEALFRRFPELCATADGLLGYPIASLCVDDPDRRLDQTLFTQPALFVVNALSYLAAVEDGAAERVAVFAGHSLGEYSALFAAGAFDFATGLRLVKARSEAMNEASEATNGIMAAIIGLPVDVVRHQCAEARAHGEVELANINDPTQVVISGEPDAVSAVVDAAKTAGAKKAVQLVVHGAFHSPLMDSATVPMNRALADAKIEAPKTRFAANTVGGLIDDPEEIRTQLGKQITGCVRWVDCVQALIADGVTHFVELGPGKVLTGLMRRINREIPCVAAGDPESLEKAREALTAGEG
jgi:trans-AT polyketide synthase/acyltransferase/oxidoreductase domain-containing protein